MDMDMDMDMDQDSQDEGDGGDEEDANMERPVANVDESPAAEPNNAMDSDPKPFVRDPRRRLSNGSQCVWDPHEPAAIKVMGRMQA